jgi:hypothetical protein
MDIWMNSTCVVQTLCRPTSHGCETLMGRYPVLMMIVTKEKKRKRKGE